MPEFMMIMKGTSGSDSKDSWDSYLNKLQNSGKFRGGSMLGNGQCMNKTDSSKTCSVTGYMRFEADNIEQVKALISGNPTYENGNDIEVLEVIFG